MYIFFQRTLHLNSHLGRVELLYRTSFFLTYFLNSEMIGQVHDVTRGIELCQLTPQFVYNAADKREDIDINRQIKRKFKIQLWHWESSLGWFHSLGL